MQLAFTLFKRISLVNLKNLCFYVETTQSLVPGGFAAGNRGADYVEHLVPPVSTAIRVKQAWWSERSKGMT